MNNNAFQWWSNYDGTYAVFDSCSHLDFDYKSPGHSLDCVLMISGSCPE